MTTTPRIAQPAEFPRLASALADAFHDDPVICHLLPEPNRRRRAERFFGVDLRGLHGRGRVYTVGDGEGAALWAAPDRWRTPVTEVLRSIVPAVRSFGTALPRAMRTLQAVESVHPHEPHWYLAVLGTETAHQGKGLGSALLTPMLEECDTTGLPAYLESSKEENVPFYARHGFEVTGELPLPSGGPTLWTMWRPPH